MERSSGGALRSAEFFPTILTKAAYDEERRRALTALGDLENDALSSNDTSLVEAYSTIEIYVEYLNSFGIEMGWLESDLPQEEE